MTKISHRIWFTIRSRRKGPTIIQFFLLLQLPESILVGRPRMAGLHLDLRVGQIFKRQLSSIWSSMELNIRPIPRPLPWWCFSGELKLYLFLYFMRKKDFFFKLVSLAFCEEKERKNRPFSLFVWHWERFEGRKIPFPLLRRYQFPLLRRRSSCWPSETNEQD